MYVDAKNFSTLFFSDRFVNLDDKPIKCDVDVNLFLFVL